MLSKDCIEYISNNAGFTGVRYDKDLIKLIYPELIDASYEDLPLYIGMVVDIPRWHSIGVINYWYYKYRLEGGV